MTPNGAANANKFSWQDVMKLYLAEIANHDNDKASLSDRGIPGSKKKIRVVSFMPGTASGANESTNKILD